MKNRKIVYLLILFTILMLPNIVMAEKIRVRTGGPSSMTYNEFDVTEGMTIVDLKTVLQNDPYNVNFSDNAFVNSYMSTLGDTENICSEEIPCAYSGPNDIKFGYIDLVPLDHTLKNFNVSSVPATSDNSMQSIGQIYYEAFEGLNYKKCDNTFTTCTFADHLHYKLYDNVHITYNYDSAIKALADSIIATGLMNTTQFYATDTEILHNLNYGDSLASYTSSFKQQVSNINFTFEMLQGAGGFEPLATIEAGFYMFLYNGVLYGVKDFVEVIGEHTIYVPDGTTDIVAAIEARLDTLFGTNNHLTVTESTDTINEMLDNCGENPISSGGDDHYYIITNTVTSEEKYFKAVKDSSKINNSIPFKSRDLITSVSVETNEDIPLDTKVRVNNITSGTDYDNILETLDVDDVEMFEITLRSDSQNIPITTLPSGKFLVSIPVPERFSGKTLIIYYVKQNNEVEEHVVTVDPETSTASFETDHFSIYSLALNPVQSASVLPLATNNPQTSDSLMDNILMLIISILFVSGLLIVYYQNKKIINKD